MEGVEGAQRVFRIMSLGVPTVVLATASYAALVDQIFLIPGAIVKRFVPTGFEVIVGVSYSLFCMMLWGILHILLLQTCYGTIGDLCVGDPLRHRYCIGSTVASLVLVNFLIYPQRAVELYTGARKQTTFFRRLVEIAPGCVAWMAAADRDASAIVLLLLLTALRLRPAGPRVAFLAGWYGRVLKVLISVLSVRAMRGDCNIQPKYAVGVAMAALCA